MTTTTIRTHKQITGETTDADIIESLLSPFRKAVSQEVLSGNRAENVAKALNQLAEAEGKANAWFHIRNARSQGATDADVQDHLLRLVLNGPDDGWSGRTNDVRRATFDGFRAEVEIFVRGF